MHTRRVHKQSVKRRQWKCAMFVEVGPLSGWQKIISRRNVTSLLECEDRTPDTTLIDSFHSNHRKATAVVIEPFHKPKRIWLIFATAVHAPSSKGSGKQNPYYTQTFDLIFALDHTIKFISP